MHVHLAIESDGTFSRLIVRINERTDYIFFGIRADIRIWNKQDNYFLTTEPNLT